MYGEANSNKERFASAISAIAATGCFGILLIMGFVSEYGRNLDRALGRTLVFSLEKVAQPESISQPRIKSESDQAPRQFDSDLPMTAPQQTPTNPLTAYASNVQGEQNATREQAIAAQSSGTALSSDVSARGEPSHDGSMREDASKLIGGASAGDDKADDNYATQVYRKVAARIQLTGVLRDKRIYGTARIRMVVDANGRLIDASLAGSSGNAELDKVALTQARSAAPFPKRPETSNWAQRSFVIPMTYRQRQP